MAFLGKKWNFLRNLSLIWKNKKSPLVLPLRAAQRSFCGHQSRPLRSVIWRWWPRKLWSFELLSTDSEKVSIIFLQNDCFQSYRSHWHRTPQIGSDYLCSWTDHGRHSCTRLCRGSSLIWTWWYWWLVRCEYRNLSGNIKGILCDLFLHPHTWTEYCLQ